MRPPGVSLSHQASLGAGALPWAGTENTVEGPCTVQVSGEGCPRPGTPVPSTIPLRGTVDQQTGSQCGSGGTAGSCLGLGGRQPLWPETLPLGERAVQKVCATRMEPGQGQGSGATRVTVVADPPGRCPPREAGSPSPGAGCQRAVRWQTPKPGGLSRVITHSASP